MLSVAGVGNSRNTDNYIFKGNTMMKTLLLFPLLLGLTSANESLLYTVDSTNTEVKYRIIDFKNFLFLIHLVHNFL